MTRVVSRPVQRGGSIRLPDLHGWQSTRLARTLAGACLLLTLVPGMHLGAAPSGAAANPRPDSWLGAGTLLTVYGRAFGTAPILGRLGMDHSLDDVARQIEPVRQEIRGNTRFRPVRVAIHLIYGLAIPCSSSDTCLLYLDETGVDIVRDYIEPAAKRGWLVILDDQLGRSNPASEIQRLIARGYLAYDNVEVAFDPEFRTVAGQVTPGIPTGTVTAGELNAAEREVDSYGAQQRLDHRKIMLVHEFQQGMIRNRRALRDRLRYVQPVLVMDGYGPPAGKAHTYRSLLRTGRHDQTVPGIKLFPFNPYERAGHLDTPLLNWRQVFGHAPAVDTDGRAYWLSPVPRVIVFT